MKTYRPTALLECGRYRADPFVGSHDDFDDLSDAEIAYVESHASFAEEEYDRNYDPFDEDAQEEEDYCGTRIVDEDEFYGNIDGDFC